MAQEGEMFICQIKIEVRQYKTDEFVTSIRSFLHKILKERGCLGYDMYRGFEKENIFILVGEWKTRQAMEKHFQTLDFEVLIGAAKVLGKTFTMNIAEVSENGGFQWVSELIMSKKQKSTKKSRA